MLLVVVIPNESPVITRDYLSGVYTIPLYYLGVATFYTIEVLISVIIVFHIVYWMVFSNTLIDEAGIYPWVFLTMILVALVAIGVGMLISSVATTFSMALSLSNPFQTVLMLYAGFLILDSRIPDPFRIFQYTSAWFYSLNINMNLVYADFETPCKEPEFHSETLDDLSEAMIKPDQNKVILEWLESFSFLHAFSHLYKRVCLSIHPSVGLSIGYTRI